MDIAVIVPTYNRADLIAETLDSILRQSYPAAEIIVVDDGSTDNTADVVAGHGRRVKYLRTVNRGVDAARNAGVALATAPWIAFCDHDDLWSYQKLSLQAELCRKAPEVKYCFTNFRIVADGVWSEGTKFDTSPQGYWDMPRRNVGAGMFVVEDDMFLRLLRHQPIFPSTLVMKKSFFETVGRWEERLGRNRSEDLEFHLRCVTRPPFGVITAPVVGIRKHRASYSADPYRTLLDQIEILEYALENHALREEFIGAIRESIALRREQAVAGAFAVGDFTKTRELLAYVPFHRRSWKLQLKGLIAHAPERTARLLRSWCVQEAGEN